MDEQGYEYGGADFSLTVKDTIEKLVEKGRPKILYSIIGDEIAPTTGKRHYQWYIRFENLVKKKNVIKYLKGIHVQKYNGGDFNNKTYSSKDKVIFEYGTPAKQGERTDLNLVKDQILAGTKVDDLTLENPNLFHQYGRTLCKLEDIAMRKKFRTEMTKGFWYYGETGAGKSHKAFENFTPDTHYVLNLNDNGWWEGYAQQETVILNEFRGQIPYSELLDLCDKYPKSVKRRNREPMPFTSKRIIVTSSLHPKDVYHNISRDDKMNQLERRFEITKIEKSHL